MKQPRLPTQNIFARCKGQMLLPAVSDPKMALISLFLKNISTVQDMKNFFDVLLNTLRLEA